MLVHTLKKTSSVIWKNNPLKILKTYALNDILPYRNNSLLYNLYDSRIQRVICFLIVILSIDIIILNFGEFIHGLYMITISTIY